ncbi:MAG: hypothetical protein ACRDZ7_04515 [Acidimicrobiia bacterium]
MLIGFLVMTTLGCSGEDDSGNSADNNNARLEAMATAEYEVIARALAAGKLGAQVELLAGMSKAAESSAGGDTVGVTPFLFFTANGQLVPYSEMSTRQKLAYNVWRARVVMSSEVIAEIKTARRGAEVRWRERQGS